VTTTADTLATVIPLGLTVLTGGLAVAWRLGGLERRVKDLGDLKTDVKELSGQLQAVARDVSAAKAELDYMKGVFDSFRG
jgi:outer membrane murein-binding lipoprotein Lpp